jgi:UDP-2,3-diacylglucosamine pyrophosphatase LpxH
MKHYQAVIISDLHLGTKDSKAEEFIEFLDNHPTDLLIMNGDIVDAWALNRGSKWKKSHTKVISKLLHLSNKIQVIWIRGNHDEFIEEFIDSRFGGIEFKENYILNLNNGTKYFVFHGDIIDVFITKYKWISKIGSIGYDLALWLNRQYNNYRRWKGLPYLSISKKIKAGVKQATNYINDFEETAVKMAEKEGCDGVICGHIHQPCKRLVNDHIYLNSGDWVENMSAILINKDSEIKLYEK